MKRADALALISYAGYHNDSARMIRLYVENKISYPIAQKQFKEGVKMKANGIKCGCNLCNGK
jgi:hypothetical protein